jgi:hypothetical protein
LPIYHFDTFNGEEIHDLKGIDIENIGDAKTMAVRYLGELLREKAEGFGDAGDWRVEVKDDTGLILFCVNLSLKIVPPVSSRQ